MIRMGAGLSARLGAWAERAALWLTALAVTAVLVTVSATRFWQSLEQRAFDAITLATSPDAQTTPIFIVAIDDQSIAALGMPWPWPRSVHAELIQALARAGAAVVVFDLVFAQATNPGQDGSLADAIQQSGNVVLGASLVQQETDYGVLQQRRDPLPDLVAAGAAVGMVALEVPEADRVVRRLPQAPDALWRVALERLQRAMPELAVDFQPPKDAYLRYLGPPRTFPYISYVDALHLDEQPGVLDGALVLVGRVAAVTTDISSAQADTFATPMTWAGGGVMSGVEIHATAMENAIRYQAIAPAHPVLHWLLLALVVWGGLFSLAGRSLRAGAGITVAWLVLILAVVFGLWTYQALFVPPLALALTPPALFLGRVAVVARKERLSRLALKRSFSLYLAAPVVEQIAADPEQLELGGEQREITLLFSDLEGFTPLSEQLTPRQIASLLNRYFEQMTQAVFRHGGTLDKFIGDAVMAFWGAPLTQDDQAERAVACARDMLAELDRFNAEQRAQRQPTLRMRIGIHTGEALVGNLGCPSRFTYTALGDSVNLAARLESANKQQGTAILISEATMQRLPAGAEGQYLGEIQVKGRTQPVRVYGYYPQDPN